MISPVQDQRLFNRLTLRFNDPAQEQLFRRESLAQVRVHGRMAMVVGIIVYLLVGLMDVWHMPSDQIAEAWVTRLIALMVPTLVLGATFTPLFNRFPQLLLSSVCVAAGVGLITVQSFLPVTAASYYYPALVMLTFYTYNFIGVRFPYALGIDIGLIVSYNLVFGVLMEYPAHILFGHDVFMISSSLIGGTTGYLLERQRRLLFIRERQLEGEREYHLKRSLHDPLTGLPNRELLYDRLRQAIRLGARNNECHAGFFIDLDGFKAINDRLGHKTGDRVLIEVGERLSGTVRKSDTVARLGGDEFFVLALGLEGKADACHLAEKLLNALREPLAGVPPELLLRASVGICLFPFPGVMPASVIHRADMAMYEVKENLKDGYCLAPEG